MRWSWIRAVIVGILMGPAPVAAESGEAVTETGDAEVVELPEPEAEARRGTTVRGLHFHVWDEDSGRAIAWADELLRCTGEAGSAGWRSVAASNARGPSILTDEMERDLARWSAPGEAAGPALGCVLCLLPALDRTCLISAWATSPEEPLRRALARALSAPFEAVGVREAVVQLQRDPSAEVRRLARSAAALRASVG